MKIIFVLFCLAFLPFTTQAVDVEITWTAVGDDGNVGTASEYDIRISDMPITGENWDSATELDNEPIPQVAGSTETFIVLGLDPESTYYIAMKVADEVPNWSGISNLLQIYVPDTTPPAVINNLSIGDR